MRPRPGERQLSCRLQHVLCVEFLSAPDTDGIARGKSCERHGAACIRSPGIRRWHGGRHDELLVLVALQRRRNFAIERVDCLRFAACSGSGVVRGEQ